MRLTVDGEKSPRQCEHCGRVDTDWVDPGTAIRGADGVKAYQRPNLEDRESRYRTWRRTFGRGIYVNDLDQIEWRGFGGEPVAVAHIELSRVDGDRPVPNSYLESAWNRFSKRDPQSTISSMVARAMEIPAYFVLYRWNLEEFWVRRFDTYMGGWVHYGADEYRRWVINL